MISTLLGNMSIIYKTEKPEKLNKNRKRRERSREGRGGTEWTVSCGAEMKKKTSLNKDNIKSRTFTMKENKESSYEMWQEEAERSKKAPTFDKDDMREVGMKAMWLDRRSLHPLSCYESSQTTHVPGIWLDSALLWTGQVVPDRHVEVD